MMPLIVVEDTASGFWTGRPWLVLDKEDEPAVASFRTDAEAFDYVEEMEGEGREKSQTRRSE